jgi:murein DD-endopeptidase MepM/ murein hydrolase activator NlpD
MVHNPNGGVSNPLVLLVGRVGYRLPYASGQSVQCSQGNNGSVDHNWSTLGGLMVYAYDLVDSISPTKAEVVAMKAGTVVNSLDNHLGQTTTFNWGNYITLQHASNEFSHYAHLSTGTFKVSVGHLVTQGTPLATVGDSGYAYSQYPGDHQGYHVHVQVTASNNINAQSVPFLFDDVYSSVGSLPGQATTGGRYTS